MKRIFILAIAIISSIPAQSRAYAPPTDEQNGWVDLFNGEDLDNWVQRNGKAEYRIEDDAIVGTTVMNTPNSFLCTQEDYSDFILEFEVLIDPLLNSGVQIRSESKAEYNNGRVHGYQVELDPSKRAWTAGIYDEARRGWMYSLTRNEPAQHAFKQGTWNKIRVEAIGHSIRTWINGVMAANLLDDMTPTGFIALQVHGIGNNEEEEGREIRWRNIRIKTEDLEDERLSSDPSVPVFNYVANTLSDYEKRKGWRLLWDGKTTAGWRGARLDEFPQGGWDIEEGILSTLDSDDPDSGEGGDIVTIDTYSEFELELEFKLTQGANSGVKYFVRTDPEKGPASTIGLEYQIIDDRAFASSAEGLSDNRALAALYDLIPAGNMSIPGRNKRFNGVERWNRVRIVVRNNHIEHWLNNEKVLEFERSTPIYRALVARSKYKEWPEFGEAAAGHILLQSHGGRVDFRNIKIRER